MSDPNFAGLDPIFWLHHCNVDRLWAAWLTVDGNVQENGNEWRGGPFPRRFQMPGPDGALNLFTPADTLPGGPLAPIYDTLTVGTGVAPSVDLDEDSAMPATLSSEPPSEARLAGASSKSLTVAPQQAATASVSLPAEDATVALSDTPERVILNLENVRGAPSSGVLNVYVSAAPAGGAQASAEELVDSVALFGLAKASSADGGHGGNGISVSIDITELAGRLAREAQDVLSRLDVRVEQPGEGTEPITVGRISVYKQPID
jgi:tyrosinase